MENGMGGACSTNGKVEAYIKFLRGNLRERNHLGETGVDGRIIINGSSGSGMCGCGLDRAG